MILKDFYDEQVENKKIKKYKKIVSKIRKTEKRLSKINDNELKEMMKEIKKAAFHNSTFIKDEKNIILSFAFASEAIYRTEKKRLYNCQLIAGLALADGNITEMKTGEGKTLAAIAPTYFMALQGYGSHIITVNEYLAQRDRDEVANIFEFLDISVGVSLSTTHPKDKKKAYLCDVTYTTNSEVGFDLLRDNTTIDASQKVQRGLYFGIVDEFDQVLIDDSKTPLISAISSEQDQGIYKKSDEFIKKLDNDDYEIDDLTYQIKFSETGVKKADKYFKVKNIYDHHNSHISNALTQSLVANYSMLKNKDYIVQDKEILIIDISTGRALEGRRLQGGLHQALEAKENVPIQNPTITTATITYKNLFQEYKVLTGMTGTVHSIKDLIEETYSKKIIRIPINKPSKRYELDPIITTNEIEKINIIIELVHKISKNNQPILIGTNTVTESIKISTRFNNLGIKHKLLNAIEIENETEIIERAGEKGSITIATNMAARGTDIKINPEVEELGGLFVIATTFFDNERIDNQLKGRSGRQGQKGHSLIIASLDDELYQQHGNEKYIEKMKNEGYLLKNRYKNIRKNKDRFDFKKYNSKMNQKRFEYTKELQRISESKAESSRKRDDEMDNNINDGSKFIYSLIDKISTLKTFSNLYDYELQLITKIEVNRQISKKELKKTPSNSAKVRLSFIKNPTKALFINQSKKSIFDNLQKLKEIENEIQENNLEISLEEITQFENQKENIQKVIMSVWHKKLEQLLVTKEAVALRAYAQVQPKDEFLKEYINTMDSYVLEIITKSNFEILTNISTVKATIAYNLSTNQNYKISNIHQKENFKKLENKKITII